jgi:hypothetical protein
MCSRFVRRKPIGNGALTTIILRTRTDTTPWKSNPAEDGKEGIEATRHCPGAETTVFADLLKSLFLPFE